VEEAGHKVEGRQDEQEIEGIKGHRDAVIDGTLVDVKSASQYSFKKFQEGKLSEAGNDPFGYVKQIQSYLEAGQEDPIISDNDRAALLVVDKPLLHITVDVHEKDKDTDFKELYKKKKEVIKHERPPNECY